MTDKMWFSPELRTASVVPRWSIVWTLTQDRLSNHSFFVALYADQIARLINWPKLKYVGPPWAAALMYIALTHDLDELITGDIVAPAKREILDTDKADAYIARNMKERLTDVVQQHDYWKKLDPAIYAEAKIIVKVADRLDALLFLTVEKRLGNSVIAPRIPECLYSLSEAWFRLPGDDVSLKIKWDTVVIPAVQAHETTGGYGI